MSAATFRTAIVGVSGPRAAGHAEAYRHVRGGRIVAVSSRRHDAREAFAQRFGVERHYADYREMLQRERPDLVHVNTPPSVRLEVLRAAEVSGVPGVVLEKPIGTSGEDYLELEAFARTTNLKVAVNHQLHFHPRRAMLQDAVRDGAIGEIRLVEASARHNVAYQGTHMLQAIRAFTPSSTPVSVLGQVSGAAGLRQSAAHHYAPDTTLAELSFDDGVRALLRCGPFAPAAGDEGLPIHLHKRVAVFGTRGFVHWTMHGWQAHSDGAHRSGRHDYEVEDTAGQVRLTEAMFDWLGDDSAVHPLALRSALEEFNLVLAIYTSALEREVRRLPLQPGPELIARLRAELAPRA